MQEGKEDFHAKAQRSKGAKPYTFLIAFNLGGFAPWRLCEKLFFSSLWFRLGRVRPWALGCKRMD
jgi:hypothetical protein